MANVQFSLSGVCLAILMASPLGANPSSPVRMGESDREVANTALSGRELAETLSGRQSASDWAQNFGCAGDMETLAGEIVTLVGKVTPLEVAYSGGQEARPGRATLFFTRTGELPRSFRLDLLVDQSKSCVEAVERAFPSPLPYELENDEGLGAEPLRDRIARRVKIATERGEFSGSILLLDGEKVVFEQSVGMADYGNGVPNSPDTLFHLGSLPKMFTAIAIAQLIEKGRLTLDTMLAEILPDYPNTQAAKAITIRHLLSHRSGLGMLFDRKGWQWEAQFASHSEYLPLFADEPLLFVPGESFSYSNEGYIVLGAVIEKLSGSGYFEYLEENIFIPAGMEITGRQITNGRPGPAAKGYAFEYRSLGLGERMVSSEMISRNANAAGGSYGNTRDLAAFYVALHAGQLVGNEILDSFLDHVDQNGRPAALGFSTQGLPNGLRIFGHGGGGPYSGINVDSGRVEGTNYSYVVLGNYDAPFAQSLARDIAAIISASAN